ncbi:MAG: DUF427 domain-containing protein [Chloroflexi bacterium]|nr:DUF427 domain-containing protein [Chloroflexota bacterium]
MVRAIRDGVVLAESDKTIVVEGNHYFPPDSVNWDNFRDSGQVTVCPWKGRAAYYDVVVGDKVIGNAGWAYHNPSAAAIAIKDYVAFYRRVAFLGKVKIEG